MEKDIGRIKKNDTSEIVVRVDNFAGRKGLTIREFITTDRYTGFTKSGVKIFADNFQNFKEMINSVTDEDMKEEPAEEKTEEIPKDQTTLEKPEGSEEKAAESQEKPAEESKENLPDY